MIKLKTLVVPEGLGRWLDYQELGKESNIFTVIDNLDKLWRGNLDGPLGYFIMLNKKELIEVIIGNRDYQVEEQLYYALIKGHELLADHDALSFTYWNFNMSNSYLFHGNQFSKQSRFLTKMTKEEWFELGINESNADFVKVEEVE